MDGGRGRRYERGAWSDRDYSQFNYIPANRLLGQGGRLELVAENWQAIASDAAPHDS
jgi:hypothetical protein